MSASLTISSVDESAIFSPEVIVRALRRIYSADEISDVLEDIPGVRKIDVNSATEPWFRVTWRDSSGIDLNGTAQQNARIAASLRAEISADAARIVAIDPDNGFVDLPWGIAADEILGHWRPFSEFTT